MQTKINIFEFIRKFFLVIALAFVLAIAIKEFPEFKDIFNTAHKISILSIVIALSLSLLSYFLRSIRWLHYVRLKEREMSPTYHFLVYMSGFAFTLTPGKVGELMRSVHLKQKLIPFRYTLSCFLSERGVDLICVLILGNLALTLVLEHVIYGLMTPLLIVLLLNLQTLLKLISKLKSLKILRELEKLWNTKISLRALALGLCSWSLQGIVLFNFISALESTLPVHLAISIYCFSLIIGALSMIPGGLGATELSITWLLTNFNVPLDTAILSAILTRMCTLWPAIILGIISCWILKRPICEKSYPELKMQKK
ncbi:lysylphosphatidylglycerol synthase transmembrane domain-containing protein [Pseudoalteromonas spongiae]|uniref:lysylphosphatidylglycerol synthase transmembrane domain-containing protein n=1 Tax=Pseudoalteromonas spongiae TaxID=298657 RepID=UPI0014864F0C|nr:lysylphosphatidylglycerol synthase transmembrane domain-containing protein [Pseudoalteromonas spongiae]